MWFLVIILVIVIIYQRVNKNIIPQNRNEFEKNNYNDKYTKKEYLLTQTELKFYKVLKSITDELNLVICPQVSLYEIVTNKEYKDFNKISRKTIDFVITEQNLKIKLCIELDDNTHSQPKRIERDKFINELFKNIGIKLIRIPVQNFYDKEEIKKQIIG